MLMKIQLLPFSSWSLSSSFHMGLKGLFLFRNIKPLTTTVQKNHFSLSSTQHMSWHGLGAQHLIFRGSKDHSQEHILLWESRPIGYFS